MLAIRENSHDCGSFKKELFIKLIENCSTEDINVRDSDGCTAIIYACSCSYRLDVITSLLDKGANIRLQSRSDYGQGSALMSAARWGRLDVLQLFYERCPESFQDVDSSGNTVLMKAVQASPANLDMIQFLLDKGANLACRNREGKTAKDFATGEIKGFFIGMEYAKKMNNIASHPVVPVANQPERSRPETLFVRRQVTDEQRNGSLIPLDLL